MQLFKSQCLQEQGRDLRIPAYRGATFGPRYGGRTVTRRTPGRCVTNVDDDVVVVAHHLPGEPGLRHLSARVLDQAA